MNTSLLRCSWLPTLAPTTTAYSPPKRAHSSVHAVPACPPRPEPPLQTARTPLYADSDSDSPARAHKSGFVQPVAVAKSPTSTAYCRRKELAAAYKRHQPVLRDQHHCFRLRGARGTLILRACSPPRVHLRCAITRTRSQCCKASVRRNKAYCSVHRRQPAL